MPQGVALLLTILIESVLAGFLVPGLGWGAGRRAALAATAGVVTTHPFAWAAILRLETAIAYLAAVALVETVVMLAKTAVYRVLVPLPWRRSLLLALLANTSSTAAGLLYYAIVL